MATCNVTDFEMSSSSDRSATPFFTPAPSTLIDALHSCMTPVWLLCQVGWKVPSASTAMPVVCPAAVKNGSRLTPTFTSECVLSIEPLPTMCQGAPGA